MINGTGDRERLRDGFSDDLSLRSRRKLNRKEKSSVVLGVVGKGYLDILNLWSTKNRDGDKGSRSNFNK